VTRLGIGFSGGLAPREVVECVRLAEDLGYESAWIAEGHGGDAFALLAACARTTRRIRLATGISSVFVRSAPTIAMAAATVDDLSDGRLVLGLGSSHRVQVEGEHGVPFVQPTARLRETVEIVRTLLGTGTVAFRGGVVTIDRFDLWFRPARPAVPIYLAALFPPLLELAGELADGALLTWPTLATARRAAEAVARGAARAGRQPVAVDLASLLPCCVADSAGALWDAAAVTGDVGLAVTIFDIMALGATLQNFAGTFVEDHTTGDPALPRTMRIGYTLAMVDPQGTMRLTMTAEWIRPPTRDSWWALAA